MSEAYISESAQSSSRQQSLGKVPRSSTAMQSTQENCNFTDLNGFQTLHNTGITGGDDFLIFFEASGLLQMRTVTHPASHAVEEHGVI